MNVEQYLWPITTVVIFIGMMAQNWKALSIAHDLAKLALQNQPLALPPTVPAHTTVTTPPASPAQTHPAEPGVDTAVDQGLVDYIKKVEGFQPKAYWDYKQYSIGYGTKATSANEVITKEEAEKRLHVEIAKANKLVTDRFGILPKGIEQALTDLTYNAGPGWEDQILGQRVKEQKWDSVKADILLYNHAGGVVNAGLTARREAEVSWFDNPL